MKRLRISLLFISALCLSACGQFTATTKNTADSITEFTIVDPYIVGARLFHDRNENGIFDFGEQLSSFSNESGKALFKPSLKSGALVRLAEKGFHNGKPFTGDLKARASISGVVSPLTTLVADGVKKSEIVSLMKEEGIEISEDEIESDPMARAKKAESDRGLSALRANMAAQLLITMNKGKMNRQMFRAQRERMRRTARLMRKAISKERFRRSKSRDASIRAAVSLSEYVSSAAAKGKESELEKLADDESKVKNIVSNLSDAYKNNPKKAFQVDESGNVSKAVIEEMDCDSWQYKYKACSLPEGNEDVISSLELTEKRSKSACEEGQSFGILEGGKGIWVHHGCRATFKLAFGADDSSGGDSGGVSAPPIADIPDAPPAPEEPPTPPVADNPPPASNGFEAAQEYENFSVSKFNAKYFNNEAFVASEMVERIAIDYPFTQFHGINAQNFSATWEGKVKMNSSRELLIRFGVSWSDVKLWINGNLIESWSNAGKEIGVPLSQGIHDIKVEHVNNWHTAGFLVSFHDKPKVSIAEATAQFQALKKPGTKYAYVGSYGSDDLYREIKVNIEPTSSPVVLALANHNGSHWTINNPHGVDIVGIFSGSHRPASSVGGAGDTPVFHVENLGYEYENPGNGAANANSIVGNAPDFGVGGYDINEVTIKFEDLPAPPPVVEDPPAPPVVDNPPAAEDRKIIDINAGDSHACAVHKSGNVRCWGANTYGQLGYGHTNDIGDNELPYESGNVKVGGPVAKVSAGMNHTCALLTNGRIKCWGRNSSGQLGLGHKNSIGDDELPTSIGLVELGGLAKDISAGANTSCALMVNGDVRCWGGSYAGEGGLGSIEPIGDNELPSSVGPIALDKKAKAVYAGQTSVCALLEDDQLRCWGSNTYGKLGSGIANSVIGAHPTRMPTYTGPVSLGGPVAQAGIKYLHACAVMKSGDVRCWGHAQNGKLGLGNLNDIGDDEVPSSVPPVDLGGRKIQAVEVGQSNTCALTEDGDVLCWGRNDDRHQLGLDAPMSIGDDETPKSVAPININGTAVKLTAFHNAFCALLDNDEIQCWGQNSAGHLGNGEDMHVLQGDNPVNAGRAKIFTADELANMQPPEADESGEVNTDLPVGQYLAKYYRNDELVHSEVVEDISANYTLSNFQGINSQDFSATWEGQFNVEEDGQEMYMDFSLQSAAVKVWINGNLHAEWEKQHKSISLNLPKGLHDIKVKYINDWHTVGFLMNFRYAARQSLSDATEEIKNLVPGNTEFVRIHRPGSGLFNQHQSETLEASANPTLVILTNYHGANWKIANPHGVNIVGVVVGSTLGSASIEGIGNAPIFHIEYFYNANHFPEASSLLSNAPVAPEVGRMNMKHDCYLGVVGMGKLVVPNGAGSENSCNAYCQRAASLQTSREVACMYKEQEIFRLPAGRSASASSAYQCTVRYIASNNLDFRDYISSGNINSSAECIAFCDSDNSGTGTKHCLGHMESSIKSY